MFSTNGLYRLFFPLLYKLTENLAGDKGVFEDIRIREIIWLKPGMYSVLLRVVIFPFNFGYGVVGHISES